MAPRKTTSTHVTLLDVARASGFSASTVSIVLNDAPLSRHVASKTKEHIRKTAREMGYHPDAFARSLRRRRSHTIGVLVFDISDPFCMSLLRGIEQTLYATPYLPIIMDANNRREQFERYLNLLLERRVEGVVVVANWLFSEIDPLSEIEKNHIPAVVVGRDLAARDMRSVVVDNEAGGYAAMEHLHRLGHRQIAILRGPEELDDSSRRWKGIQRFAADAALEIDPRLTAILPAALDPTSGFDGGLRLTTGLIEKGRTFSAILAFDDLTALGAIRALWKAGLSVPRDCSVIGFDDIPAATLNSPGITTIRQPMQEMGSLATRLVLEAVSVPEGGAANRQMLYPMGPELIRRESTQEFSAVLQRNIT